LVDGGDGLGGLLRGDREELSLRGDGRE